MLNVIRWVAAGVIGIILLPVIFAIYVVTMFLLLVMLLLDMVGLNLEKPENIVFTALKRSVRWYGKMITSILPPEALEIET